MPGRTDHPGADPADRPGPDVPARGSQDELRRRLDSLPPGHPSSPWYRERPARPEVQGATDRAKPEDHGGGRSGESRVDSAAGDGGRRGDGGEAAAAVRRTAEKALPGGRAREQDADRRRADEALWLRAANWKAASEARRREHGGGTPLAPRGRREPFQPWFTESAGAELWLSADGTGEPWFFEDWT